MFFERGYEATTTQDIGSALGLLKGSVYYYISSKQDLLFELVQQYHDDTRSYFEAIVASDAAPVDKLRELITTETTHTARNLERSTLFYTEWRSLPQDRQAVIIAERARHERAVQEWIAQAQEVGGNPAGDRSEDRFLRHLRNGELGVPLVHAGRPQERGGDRPGLQRPRAGRLAGARLKRVRPR
jgi:AcrR family transcriptional regulator